MSIVQNDVIEQQQQHKLQQQNENNLLKSFDSFYVKLKESILKYYKADSNATRELQTAFERLERATDYNVPHGKKLRGLCTYQSCLILKGVNQSQDEEKALALGWCIELLQASFLVADDIMDNSKTRRGKTCWYLNDKIGNSAINDSFYLIFAVYQIIREYTSNHPMYAKFYELFSEVSMQTCIGQTLDLATGTTPDGQFTHYTEERYNTIVKWKTAFYSFYLPVACSLYLACIDDARVHASVKEILLKMGHFFQVQDDYLDCYGDPNVTGKIGTDIEECKCGWLFIQAMKYCSKDQLEILKLNYGRNEPECVRIVKQIYSELNLIGIYKSYENEQYNELKRQINSIEFDNFQFNAQIRQLLNVYVNKIFKRNA